MMLLKQMLTMKIIRITTVSCLKRGIVSVKNHKRHDATINSSHLLTVGF